MGPSPAIAVYHTSGGATGELGTVIGEKEDVVEVLTSGGYEMDFSYNGDAGNPEYIYYSGSGCTGSAYLNNGDGVAGDYMNPRQVFWGTTNGGTLYVVSSTASVSESYASAIDPSSADEQGEGCTASPSSSETWPLSSVSPSTIGIPSPSSITSITLSSG